MSMPVRSGTIPTAATLIARLEQLAASAPLAPERVRSALAEALADERDWLPQRLQRRDPGQPWALHPVHRSADRRWSALVAVFAPGATAPVHDHGTWAAIGIYRGEERETWFRHRDDEGASPRLLPARTFTNPRGSVHLVPDGTIHTVAALDAGAVSIHVYGTDIVTQERRTFDVETGAVAGYRPHFETTR